MRRTALWVTWIELVGGERDGQRLAIPDDAPMFYHVAAIPSLSVFSDPKIGYHTYQMILDLSGYPSRDDEGVLRYQYRDTTWT